MVDGAEDVLAELGKVANNVGNELRVGLLVAVLGIVRGRIQHLVEDKIHIAAWRLQTTEEAVGQTQNKNIFF